MSGAREQRLRTLVTQEAARIVIEEGVKDFHAAKRKAAQRLKFTERHLLPSNVEIEQAILERQRLFHGDSHPEELRRLRGIALRALRLLDAYTPRLTGSVLSGSAGAHSDVNLHVFADSSEEVIIKLMQLGIPYRTSERRLRVRPDEPSQAFPSIRFSAEDTDIELIVFPADGARQAPLSPVDGRPMPRADRERVEKLLEEAG